MDALPRVARICHLVWASRIFASWIASVIPGFLTARYQQLAQVLCFAIPQMDAEIIVSQFSKRRLETLTRTSRSVARMPKGTAILRTLDRIPYWLNVVFSQEGKTTKRFPNRTYRNMILAQICWPKNLGYFSSNNLWKYGTNPRGDYCARYCTRAISHLHCAQSSWSFYSRSMIQNIGRAYLQHRDNIITQHLLLPLR